MNEFHAVWLRKALKHISVETFQESNRTVQEMFIERIGNILDEIGFPALEEIRNNYLHGYAIILVIDGREVTVDGITFYGWQQLVDLAKFTFETIDKGKSERIPAGYGKNRVN